MYIVRKILYGILVLYGVATLVFFLFNIIPGDPVRMMLGQRADEKDVQAIRSELGLDKPIVQQYLGYINDLSPLSFYREENPTLDKVSHIRILRVGEVSVVAKTPYLRYSYQSRRGVGDILREAFPNTLLLALVAMGFATVIGLVIGTLAAVVDADWINRLTLFVTTLGMSLPSFFAAILVAYIFGFVFTDITGLSMTGSLYGVDDYTGETCLNLRNLILPSLTLGLRPLAVITELVRTSLLETMSMDYIRTAKAKGLSKGRIVAVHALRNALTPVVTAVSGWFASLLAGAVFVEYVFDWKGIGVVIVNALNTFDFPVIMGSVLLIGMMLVVINIIVDIIYGVLDPRVRLS